MVNFSIHRDGTTCNATTTPSCHAFTGFDAATVIFNVSCWSKYNISGSAQCSPAVDADWIITDADICDAQEADIGTGKIKIRTGGTLSLINTANVTAKGIEINRTGDSIFIGRRCELRIG